MPPSLKAADRSHRGRLPAFVCADPERARYVGGQGTYHPMRWAHDVQGHFRALSPPVPPDEALIVLEADNGRIMAASHFGFSNAGDRWRIFALAVHVDHWKQGLGSAMLQQTLAIMRSNQLGLPVETRIHPLNVASKAMSAKAGFAFEYEDSDMEFWFRSHP